VRNKGMITAAYIVGIEFINLANYIESKRSRKVDLVSKNGVKPKYFNQIQSEIIYDQT
jgi:hypothetical protein